MKTVSKMVFVSTSLILNTFMSSAQSRLPEESLKEPMVCSFNCSTTYSELDKNCSTSGSGIVEIDTSIDVNPFIEFGEIIRYLKNDKNNPFLLHYTFRQCEATCNAASTIDANSREVIYYNQNFLNKIRGSEKKVQWAVRCIIAHEIGHHIMGHTQASSAGINSNERRRRERRADFFTGFVISRFPGSVEQDALEGIQTLDPSQYRPRNEAEERIDIYPTLANRIAAVREGFKLASNPKNPLVIAMFKSIDSLATSLVVTNGRSTIYHVIDLNLSMRDFSKAKEIVTEQLSIPGSEKDALLWEYKSITEQNIGKSVDAIGSQRKAVELDRTNISALERLQKLLQNGNSIQKIESEQLKELLKTERIKQKETN